MMKKVFSQIKYILIFAIAAVSMVCFSVLKQNEQTVQETLAYNIQTGTEIWSSLEDVSESKYNLYAQYPIVSENQTDSNLCWIYSSLKSLETSFMVQKNEYYNFSEVGQAYLYYYYSVGGSSKVFNSSGNFYEFVNAYQDYGLILESDFSNDYFDEINSNSDKSSYYSYIKNFASLELNDYFTPFSLEKTEWKNPNSGEDESYKKNLSKDEKIEIAKKLLKNYGGLYAGIEGGGCFYTESNETTTDGIYWFYDRVKSNHNQSNATPPINLTESHAITVIGWDDTIKFGTETGAFIALNSWGFEEKSVELFYIPYSYEYALNTFCGFICNDDEMEISIANESSASFNLGLLNSSETLNNYFCYDDDISINYKLETQNISDISVEITKGGAGHTKNFSISRNDEEKTIRVTLNKSSEFYGGYYTINFYNESVLIGKRGIYVFSGTEIGNFKIISYDNYKYEFEEYIFNNAFLSTDNVATLNVAGANTYLFTFEFANTTNYTTVQYSKLKNKWRGFEANVSSVVSEVSVINSGNSSLETLYTSEQFTSESGLFAIPTASEVKNQFSLQIGYGIELYELRTSLLKFKITINSVLYENCAKDFYINLFISQDVNADSDSLNTIVYDLDGGENDTRNITKFPNYLNDSGMTKVSLYSPSKIGFVFGGWYLNENFEGDSINEISASLVGNIKLYARWLNDNISYFQIELEKATITDYDGNIKSLSDAIIYGDSVIVNLKFTENIGISGRTYTVFYYFYGTETESGYLNQSSNVNNVITQPLYLNFPYLKSGNHTFKIRVIVDITGFGSSTKETSISLQVAKKKVDFEFSKLEKPYNGTVQKPDVIKKGFYAEDTTVSDDKLLNLYCKVESKNVGTYQYSIEEIYNINYYFDGKYTCNFRISKLGILVEWQDDYYQVYDGKNHLPKYKVLNLIEGDSVSFNLTITECINAGHYRVNIDENTITNSNYTVGENEDFEFDILKAQIKIILKNTTDRVQTKSQKRKSPSYEIEGKYYSDLVVNVSSEALVAQKSGNYPISCTINSENYECEIKKATYTLTGFYYVYYQLENGKAYAEKVEEGGTPTGVTKKQLDTPLFSKISYSEDYTVTGNDIYVAVSLEDYSGIAYSLIFVGVFVIVCVIYYIKKRGSSVR